ncbi:zinc-dependent alcohol dehydrogenase [Novosphingobium colocasiae]|nr:zinc-binding dehydrogenase [Novosphingobium colocasiae]
MKTGLILGTGKFELREVDNPVVRKGGAVVAISLCGICGSDIGAYKHGDDSPFAYPPAVCGHEWCGVIEDLDPEIDYLAVGDRVIFSAPPPCGTNCTACRQGKYSACSSIVAAFFGQDGFSPNSGGFAPRQCVDARRLIRMPDEISDIEGAMAEPASVASHCVRRSGLLTGDRVAVIGAGPIGLFTLQAAAASGAQDILVIEPSATRRELARQLGATHVCAPGREATECIGDITRGLGVDQVFECAGVAATLQDATTYVRQRGTVNLLGLSGVKAAIDTDSWLVKEIAIQTSLGFDKADMEAALVNMTNGSINTKSMLTDTIPLENLESTIKEISNGRDSVKILVDPRDIS